MYTHLRNPTVTVVVEAASTSEALVRLTEVAVASSKPKVAFHTLGCKVNQYETKAIAGMFEEAGYEVVSETDWADVYVINTCTVTAVADKKSRQYIRRMKKVNPESIVAVTGCYAQIKPEEVAEIQGRTI